MLTYGDKQQLTGLVELPGLCVVLYIMDIMGHSRSNKQRLVIASATVSALTRFITSTLSCTIPVNPQPHAIQVRKDRKIRIVPIGCCNALSFD